MKVYTNFGILPQMMMKLVIGLVLALLITIGAFISYAVYKDYQFTEFINSFEFESEYVTQDATDGGKANILKGDGDILSDAITDLFANAEQRPTTSATDTSAHTPLLCISLKYKL